MIKVDGLYHMFYCTFQKLPEKNYMNHAVSTDLDVWTEIPEDRFASDDVIYEPITGGIRLFSGVRRKTAGG